MFTKQDSAGSGWDRYVYTMKTDGSDLRRLTFPDDTISCGPDLERECGTGIARNPHWGPDGERIAYVSSRGPEHWSIVVMNADGSNKRSIAGVADKPRWSPDGEQLLVRERGFLGTVGGTYLVNVDGSDYSCAFCYDASPVTFQGDTLSAVNAQWGPTSDLLFFFSYPNDVDQPDRFGSLYLFRISTREVVSKVASFNLQEDLSIGNHGVLSPDGKQVLFPDKKNLYHLAPLGVPARQLTEGPQCSTCADFDVNWGNNSRHFVYARFHPGGESYIRLSSVVGGGEGKRVSTVTGRFPDLFISEDHR